MGWIGILLLVVHIGACGGLILIVLLQAGKGASLGAAFGGGASQTVFGARSATLIGRLTWVLAALFMATSLLLTIISPYGETKGAPGTDILHEETVPQSSQTGTSQQGVPESPLSGEVTPAAGAGTAPAAASTAPAASESSSQATTGETGPTHEPEKKAAPAEKQPQAEPSQPAEAPETHK